MTRIRSVCSAVGCFLVTLGMASCGSSGSTTSRAEVVASDAGQCESLNVATYMSMLPGGAEVVQAMLSANQNKHPAVCPFHTPISPIDPLGDIDRLITSGPRPDVFTLQAELMPAFLQAHGSTSVYPLNDFLASPSEADVQANVYPHFLEEATFDGKIAGMPFGALCANAFFYNKTIFAANHLNPPTTIAELRNVCQTLKAAGIIPIEVSTWAIFLQDLIAAVMGSDAFHTYMKGGTPDQTLLRKAIDLFEEMVDNNWVDVSAGPAAIDVPLGAFMSSRSGMLFAIEWAEGSFIQLGWTPGVDYGIMYAPDNAGLFVYTLQELVILSDSPHLQASLDFADTSASTEIQNLLPITHARKYADKNSLNPERRVLVEGMEQAKHHFSTNVVTAWEMSIYTFMQSTPRDKEALLQVLLSTR